VLITHTDTDPFNPDHPVAHAAVDRARGLAAGADEYLTKPFDPDDLVDMVRRLATEATSA